MSLIRTASSAAITPTNTDDCNITAVCDNAAAAANPAQKIDTRSRFGRWFSNLICGGRHGPSLYASPTSYRPVVVSKTSPSRRIRQRQSLQATASERAPQVARSVTLDGPKTAGDVHDYVPEISADNHCSDYPTEFAVVYDECGAKRHEWFTRSCAQELHQRGKTIWTAGN
ncbi:hypothetical protein FOZ62_025360 [Perkinsus olseni]|uniref:Uncharacterized protein n=1 Tax=Perkinsus olseni TaxID=32597 RepID=A0A7J6TMI0_PEROL|nr:hypothetical protein FOZ62_025360 [Perkinsus olseni]